MNELETLVGELLESLFVFSVVTPHPVWVKALNPNDMDWDLFALLPGNAALTLRIKELIETARIEGEQP